MKIPVLILAGGQGSRMGYRNKAELLIREQTFLEKILHEFQEEQCYISTRPSYTPEISGVNLIIDKNENRGPMEGILQAFTQTSHEAFFVIGCDMPFMTKEVYQVLCSYFEPPKGVIVQGNKRRFPLGAIYTREMMKEMTAKIKEKDYRLKSLFHNENSKILTQDQINIDFQCFANINFEEEYQQLIKNNGGFT